MLKLPDPGYKFCPFCGQPLGTKIQEGKTYQYCAADNWTFYPHVGAAACAVIISADKVLLVKRLREPYKNHWVVPAGYIEFGEHPEETIHREVEEETNLKVKGLRFLQVIQATDDPRSPGHFAFFYLTAVIGDELKTDPEENGAIEWFPLNSLPLIGFRSHRDILEKIAQNPALYQI